MAKGIFTLKQVNQAIRQDAWTAFHPPKFVEYLIVGGGGGGGGAVGSSGQGGGGGAGGLLSGIISVTTGASYTVTVGSGGSGTAYPATSGTSSVFNYVTAFGGGGGGNYNTKPGLSGGSGGGAGGDSSNTGAFIGGEGIFGQGNKGGASIQAGASADGTVAGGGGGVTGGGGGAGTVGTDSVGTYASVTGLGGTGGQGLASAITGISVIYAGGGGGSSNGTGGLGGAGGGGLGGTGNGVGVHGSFGFGGGGGGHYNANTTAGNGGTGVVIIRYPGTTQFFTGGTLSYANGYIIHTFYATGTLAPTTPTTYVNADYQISRSVRMNQADNALFTRTVSSGNRRTWTWSGWVKRSLLQTTSTDYLPMLWTSTDQSSGSAYLQFGSYGDATAINCLNFNDQAGGSYNATTLATFRDTSAWYHIVCAYDTRESLVTDRVKLYVNGVKQALTAGSTFQTQNAEGYFNYSSFQHKIGGYGGAVQMHQFDGYMAEVNFIDGQALTPSSFGWTNPTTGVWAPIKFVGTYGTNGFYVNFSDNSNVTAATLGADTSGNGNNWTPNNFSVTAGAGNDSLVDTPTLYGTDTGVGGEVRGNYCTFSRLDKATTVTLSNGNLDVVGTGSGGRARASMAVSSGKWYFEFLLNARDNGGYTGFMATTARADVTGGGGTTDLGQNADTWGVEAYYGTVRNNSTSGTSVSAITNGSIGMFALDMDSGKFWYGVNGTWSNSGNPATGANPVYSNLSGYTIAPAVGWGNSTVISFSFNFGQRAFAYTAPSGYKALCTTNLSTPTIGATAATLASKYFNAITYSGNGAASSNDTQNIVTPFYPDFVWLKGRSGSDSTFYHRIASTGLTSGSYLSTNDTAAEQTVNNYISEFASTYFQVKAQGAGGANLVGSTYVAWTWNAGNGTSVTNTSGSITSSVSASPTSGFSVVTYTGNGIAGATRGHGLGVAPNMILIKGRTNVDSWHVYHSSLGNTSGLLLNSNSGSIVSPYFWNDTSPSSTVFTTNLGTSNNANGVNYVAYCFASVAGYSAFGSYTGNGSADGPFVHTGFRPKWLMIKRYDTTNNWVIQDTSRSVYNVSQNNIYADSTGAEASYGAELTDILSNGFKQRGTGISMNASGGTYIYMAFAENPSKYSLAR